MRLFVALEVPETVRREVERRAARVRREVPRARWVRSETLHLTLVFLGETDPERLPALAEALGPAFAASPPFLVQLRDGGSFPPQRSARVAWIGVEAGEELRRLQARVAAAATAAVETEPDGRPYHPHLTLARCSPPWGRHQIDTFLRAFRGPVGESFTVERGVLVESHLGAGGARHETIATFPMQAPAGEA